MKPDLMKKAVRHYRYIDNFATLDITVLVYDDLGEFSHTKVLRGEGPIIVFKDEFSGAHHIRGNFGVGSKANFRTYHQHDVMNIIVWNGELQEETIFSDEDDT
jgi:hypothetical protein